MLPRFTALFVFTVLGLSALANHSHAQVGGIFIDAQGLLNDATKMTAAERAKVLGAAEIQPPSSKQLATPNDARRISLKRLLATIKQHRDAGAEIPIDVQLMGGLTSVTHILFDTSERDVILIGPSESWQRSPTGEVVGVKSNRPILQLDDFVQAIRFAFAEKQLAPFIGCSIDPTQEGQVKYARYISGLRGMDRTRLPQIFAGMEQAMGPQNVRVFGVKPNSQFALKLVAADYRLKRISMGHDPAPVRGFTNFLDLKAQRFTGGPQRQHRWWLVPKFDAIKQSTDGTAIELAGIGLNVQTAPTSAGATTATATAKRFSTTATKLMPQIAKVLPIFAEVENLAVSCVVAELIAQKAFDANWAEKTWDPDFLLEEAKFPTRTVTVPKQVPSISTYRLVRNRHWIISVSGGVEISPGKIVSPGNLETSSSNDVSMSTVAKPDDPKAWWWDTK